MKKKIILIVLLVVVILGLAFLGQWYVDQNHGEAPVVKVFHLETETFNLGKSVKLEMVKVPAGTFRMGSEKDVLSFLPGRVKPESNEQPAHAVELSEFWMGKHEVTQEQYAAVMGNNPSYHKGAKNPVEQVLWDDAMEFCKRLSNSTGSSFTLPTEAQWEYACRAGSKTAYCFGNMESILGDYAWYDMNSGNGTHPVGLKMSNHWGLYDIHGNVFEWCRDYHDHYYYGTPSAKLKNPENTKMSDYRVLRGGGWDDNSGYCRSVDRHLSKPVNRSHNIGFRVVRTQP